MTGTYNPLETPETVQKRRRFLLPVSLFIVLLVVIAAGMYAWYYRVNPCEVRAVEEASTFLVTQLKTYDGVYQFASTVYRSGLARPVNMLQRIFMDTREVEVPVCMQAAKEELLNYMGTVISAFQAYMAAESDATIRGRVDQSNKHYDNFKRELEAVNKCAPFCAPWDYSRISTYFRFGG